MPVGPGGYPTAYRRGAQGSQTRPAGAPQARAVSLTREISKGYARSLSTAQSLGELVPYQAGTPPTRSAPHTQSAPPTKGTNLTRLMSGGYHSPSASPGPMTFTPPSAASMARTAALIASRALGRGGPGLAAQLALHGAQFVYDNWDSIMDLFGGAGATGTWGELPGEFQYNHPPNAELLQDCGVEPTTGPSEISGACQAINHYDVTVWADALTPGYNTGASFHSWSYHREHGLNELGRQLAEKASGWRAPKAGPGPGPLIVKPAQAVQVVDPLAQPAVQTTGSGGPPVQSRVANPFRHERAKGQAQRGFALASGFYGQVDEVREFVDAMHDALEGPCKRRNARGIMAKVSDILRCAGTLNLDRLARNLITNEVEDRIIGRSIGAASRTTRWVRGGVGSAITGPAL